jgi:hypothetical protein
LNPSALRERAAHTFISLSLEGEGNEGEDVLNKKLPDYAVK